MSSVYEQNKKSIYNWNARNPDRKKELNRIYQRRRYVWKKISADFRHILLDEYIF